MRGASGRPAARGLLELDDELARAAYVEVQRGEAREADRGDLAVSAVQLPRPTVDRTRAKLELSEKVVAAQDALERLVERVTHDEAIDLCENVDAATLTDVDRRWRVEAKSDRIDQLADGLLDQAMYVQEAGVTQRVRRVDRHGRAGGVLTGFRRSDREAAELEQDRFGGRWDLREPSLRQGLSPCRDGVRHSTRGVPTRGAEIRECRR
jgi:hypothetical protein